METKAWGGRFNEPTHDLVEHFTASIPFDRRLYAYDIQGSVAHCRMLAKCGIITDDEARQIVVGLQAIEAEIERGEFRFEVRWEDIHMHIERRLIETIGPVGGKLHRMILQTISMQCGANTPSSKARSTIKLKQTFLYHRFRAECCRIS